MTQTERHELIRVVADIGTHTEEFPGSSPVEKELIKTIQFLCMAIVQIIDNQGS